MKKQIQILLMAVITLSLITSCNKQVADLPSEPVSKVRIEKTTVGEARVKYGIDLIKAWEISTLPEGFVARVSKGRKPKDEDAVTLTWGSTTLNSVDNGDGTVTHTWTLPADPKFSAMQHSDGANTDGTIDLSTDAQGEFNATGVFSFANYYQYSYFLAGQPYVLSFTYPDVGGYYRQWATDMLDAVFVSNTTNP